MSPPIMNLQQSGCHIPLSPQLLHQKLAPFLPSPSSQAFPSSSSNTDINTNTTSSFKLPHSRLSQASAHTSASALIANVPGTSRVGVDVGQRIDPKITVKTAWRFLPFLTKQATNIVSSFVSHHLYGPPKKSWGIEMTIFTAFVRYAASFSHLSSIHQLRMILDLGYILPTPNDGIITPVSFKVKKQGLRGFLSELDQAEDGKRMLTGEWVLSKKTWSRMQQDSLRRRNQQKSSSNGLGDEKVIFFIHGGAYFVMSATTHRPLTISIAKYTECRLFAINYRLAPETRFPGPLHDVAVAYLRLLNDLKIPAKNIVVAGDSAGGGMVTSLMLYLRDEGYPLPSGAMLLSPWCDLTMSCDSWETNQAFDFLPMPKPDDPLNPVKCYLGEEGVKKWITHPYVSPLFGDLHGLPPLLIQAGDSEVLRDEVTLLAHKASLHDVRVFHELYEDCVHVFQFFRFLEASKKALQSMRHFVRHTLPALEAQTAEAEEDMRNAQSVDQGSPKSNDSLSVEATSSASDCSQSGGETGSDEATDRAADAVDREISSDAHLVDDNSRTVAPSLPPSPTIPGHEVGGEEDESDERLSEVEEEGSDNEPDLVPAREPASASLSSVQQGKLPWHKATPSFNLSLHGRLPPATVDPEKFKDPTPHRRQRSLDGPSSNPSRTHTRLHTMSSGMLTYSTQLSTPQIHRATPDVRELVSELCETPSLLRTKVYCQQQLEAGDAEDYFWSTDTPTVEEVEEGAEEEEDEHKLEAIEPTVPEYPFQTPGYGFS